MSNILATGGTGLFGRAIMKELIRAGQFTVRGTGLHRSGHNIDKLDICDPTSTRAYVQQLQPDVIVHCAAERRPDVSEADPEGTEKLNVGGTQLIVDCAKEVGAWVIYISTDYVFDGSKPPYQPGDKTNPLNLYGKSKVEGEEITLAGAPDNCVLRIPMLYGDVESLAESSVTIIAVAMQETKKDEIIFDHWSTRYPTLVADGAVVMRQLVEERAKNPNFGGICHWSGDEPMTKFEMASVMARSLDRQGLRIIANPEPSGDTPRPKDCHLDCSLLEGLGIGQRTSFYEIIDPILREHLG